jgi:hypothetical protein
LENKLESAIGEDEDEEIHPFERNSAEDSTADNCQTRVSDQVHAMEPNHNATIQGKDMWITFDFKFLTHLCFRWYRNFYDQ